MAAAGSSPSMFLAQLAERWPIELWRDVPVLAAVSGGSDSVALIRALHALAPERLHVAHFNHRLRGDDSDRDQAFVEQLARSLGRPCIVGQTTRSELDTEYRDGVEAVTRSERYAFLEQTAGRCGARYLVTAHTADDQAETILHRILRSTGLTGLAGIPRLRRLNDSCALVRPLLSFHRDELRAYLASIGQAYRDDLSNLDRRFTRNRIRHELLPQLAAEYNPGVSDALLRLGALAAEMQPWIDSLVEPWIEQALVARSDEQITLDLRQLRDQPPYLLRELFVRLWKQQGWPRQAMGHDEWSRLAEFAHRPSSAAGPILPGGCEVRYHTDRDAIVITRVVAG